MNNDERHYNINKLNIIFAVSSVILLMALGWMVMDDYFRTWKDRQKEFRTLEIEKTRVKEDAALRQLDGMPEYQDLLKELEQAKIDSEKNCSDLSDTRKEAEQLMAENEILIQNQKFTAAKLDAARYLYESDKAYHGSKLGLSQREFEELSKKVRELDLAVERSNFNLAEKTNVLDGCSAQLKNIERAQRELTKKAEVLGLKLSKIDPDKMDFTNRVADLVRDLPVVDLANPNYKIEQIVLKDITEDVNFVKVPKVDRCITCHLGIDNPDYQDAPQPYTTHPRLDVFIGRESPHAMEEFGCTVCHGGRGRGTDFVSSAHTPSSPEQAKEWKKKYEWEALHHWEKPMLPSQYTQASCLKCHSGETVIKEAEKLNLGLHIIEKGGCYSCHAIEKYKGWPKPGPSLTKVASKVSKDWAFRWINDPQSFRHNTWMPAFFGQSNNSDAESKKRTQQEIHATLDYLFKNSVKYDMSKIPVSGDLEKGKELVASIGCLGCHQIQPDKTDDRVTLDSLLKEHGPNLIGIGTKTSKEWIYNWLKDPTSYHSKTKMPKLRLSDQEASDIAAYLTALKNDAFNEVPIPPVNEEAVNEIVSGFLGKEKTQQETDDQMAAMSLDDKLLYAGKKLIRHYGCFSCHDIAGFETDKPIGTELTEEGDKSVHKLDFGFVDIDHSNHAWFTQKFKEPRIFDKDRVKAPDEKLRMPNFYFTDEEAEALVTAILGLVKERPEAKIVPRSTKNLYIEDGQRIVRQLNCRGCHSIEGEGGMIQSPVKEWLVNYDNRSPAEAEAIVKSFSPPNLIGEGKKVQAQWLFHFLHDPTVIRPWLKARMPTYGLNAAEINTLLKYFNALDDQEFPFDEKVNTALSPEEHDAAVKLFSNDYFSCAKCHIVGDQLPPGSPDSWAPNFALAKTRLKPEWIIQWIADPQSLLPGTKMPTYFDPQGFDVSGPDDVLAGDEREQIRVLRNYLLTLSGDQETEKKSEEQLEAAPSTIIETLQAIPIAEP